VHCQKRDQSFTTRKLRRSPGKDGKEEGEGGYKKKKD
jgi:hypothetical protein